MPNVMRLSDGTNNVDFSPAPGYVQPQARKRAVHSTLDSTPYIYEWGNKKLDEVPVTAFSKTNADRCNGWWEDLQELSYYSDFENNPTSNITVVIINETTPLEMMKMKRFGYLYSGTFILREL